MVVRAKNCPLSGAKVPSKQKAMVGKVMAASKGAQQGQGDPGGKLTCGKAMVSRYSLCGFSASMISMFGG